MPAVTPPAAVLLAHAPSTLWPTAVAAGVLVVALCARGHLLDPRRAQAGPTVRLVAVAAGVSVALVALSPSIERASSATFSAHMVQHLLLISVAAPLLALARPTRMLGRVVRDGLGPRPPVLRAAPRPRRWVGGTTACGLATAFSVGVLWTWHAPRLYDAALGSEVVHVVEHVTLFGAAWWFWVVVVHPRTPSYVALGALLAAAVAHSLLGGLLTFSGRSLSGVYGVDALGDQQLAGLLMWVPGGAIHLLGGVLVVVAWIDRSQRRTTVRERAVLTGAGRPG